jgi:hypothetical protein
LGGVRLISGDQPLCEAVSAEHDAAKMMNGDSVDKVKLSWAMQATSHFV